MIGLLRSRCCPNLEADYGLLVAGQILMGPDLYRDYQMALHRGNQTFLAWLKDQTFYDLEKVLTEPGP